MKRILSIALGLFGTLSLLAQSNPSISVKSNVDEALLYLGGAQISRSVTVNIPKGTTTLVFRDLPNTLDPSTYSVEGKGAFTILSIKEGFSTQPQTLPKQAQQIKDSLTLLLAQKEDVEMLQGVLDEEERFLNMNRTIGGQQTGISAAELRQTNEFYRNRLGEVKKGQLANRRKLTKLNQDIERLKARLYPFSADRVALNQELAITVMADRPVSGSIKVSYFTRAASWAPMYDIRSSGPGEPVELILRASASNITGENWENTKFTFSTGQPSEGATPPVMQPWFLRPIQPPRPVAAPMAMSRAKMQPEMAYEVEAFADMDIAGSAADFSVRQDAMIATEYSIPIAYSLSTGKDPLIVEIEKKILDATYEYLALPKLSPRAYLMAKIPNTDQLNLLSAKASIYLGGAYTGSSFIGPSMTTDTLTLPLGVDNAIIVERNRIKDYKTKRFIGSKVTETVGWDISVRNNKRTPITVKLVDQIPVSTDRSITVDADNISGGQLNKETGIISWRITVDPTGSKTVRLTYKVEYPRDMNLYIE